MNISIEGKNKLRRVLIITLGGMMGGLLIINLKIPLPENNLLVPIPPDQIFFSSIIGAFLALGYAIFGEITRKKKMVIKIVGKTLGTLLFFFMGFLIMCVLAIKNRNLLEGIDWILCWFIGFVIICIPIGLGISVGEEIIKSKNLLAKIMVEISLSIILTGIITFPFWHISGYLIGGCIGSGIAFGSAVAHSVWRQ